MNINVNIITDVILLNWSIGILNFEVCVYKSFFETGNIEDGKVRQQYKKHISYLWVNIPERRVAYQFPILGSV